MKEATDTQAKMKAQYKEQIEIMHNRLAEKEHAEGELIGEICDKEAQNRLAVDRLLKERQEALRKQSEAQDDRQVALNEAALTKREQEKAKEQMERMKEDMAADPMNVVKTASKRQAEAIESITKRVCPEMVTDNTPSSSQFNHRGKLKTVPSPTESKPMVFQDVRALLLVRPTVRERIFKDEFIPLSEILHDPSSSANLQKIEYKENGVTTTTTTTLPKSKGAKSKLEIIDKLLKFASYYLQKYPEKTITVLDYLQFLIKECGNLTVAGILHLDDGLHRLFTQDPSVPWSANSYDAWVHIHDTTSKSHFMLSEVHKNNSNNYQNQSQNTGSGNGSFKSQNSQNSWGNGNGCGRGGFQQNKQNFQNNQPPHKPFDREAAALTICENWNYRSCKRPDCV